MHASIGPRRLVVAAALLLCLGLLAVDARSPAAAAAATKASVVSRCHHPSRPAFLLARGGATLVDDEYDSEDEYDEYDEEEDEEEEAAAAAALAAAAKAKAKKKASMAKAKADALSKSAVRATSKAKAKKTFQAKAAVSATLTKPKKSKSSRSILKALHVPYLIRACLNPLTVIAMTRAYFASLFNISYLEEESSQGLRSALEEKAKKEQSSGGGGGRKKGGKRIMKPGQAKTLSDLPQLSA